MNANHKMFSPWSEVTSGERNQVVFEYLNKNYGAYQIRTNYDRTLLKVFLATGLGLTLFSAIIMLINSDPILARKFPKDDSDIFNPKKIMEDIFVPKIPELPKTSVIPKSHQSLIPEMITEPQKKDDENILPPKTNGNPNGTPCDSCPDDPDIIPGPPKNTGSIIEDDPEKVHEIGGIDIMPHFPGGDPELYKYLKANTHIPEPIRERGNIKERVGIVFIIDKDGSVTSPDIKHGSKYTELNNEALRVVKKMPKWGPGMQNGKPVKVRLIIPFRFEVI